MDDLPVTTLVDTEQSSEWSILNDTQSSVDILAMPEGLNDAPEWIRTPLRRFLRLKQRNWPAKNLRQRTRNLCNRMNYIISFFIQHYEWSGYQQLSPRWLEDYIDTRLREGKAANTINWDLIYFRALCHFLIEEGFDVPSSILKLKILGTPRRLPNPLSLEQVHRVERCIQTAIAKAKNDRKQQLAVRDLACFYLLWHCGLRISEVSFLLVKDVDFESRKLFIRNSKARKDRMVYISDTVSMVLQQDYYQGIATLDPGSGILSMSGLGLPQQRKLRPLVEELRTPGLDQSRHDEILDIILANIS